MPLSLLVRKRKNEIHNIKNNNVNITTSKGSIELYIAPDLNDNFEMKISNLSIDLYKLICSDKK